MYKALDRERIWKTALSLHMLVLHAYFEKIWKNTAYQFLSLRPLWARDIMFSGCTSTSVSMYPSSAKSFGTSCWFPERFSASFSPFLSWPLYTNWMDPPDTPLIWQKSSQVLVSYYALSAHGMRITNNFLRTKNSTDDSPLRLVMYVVLMFTYSQVLILREEGKIVV